MEAPAAPGRARIGASDDAPPSESGSATWNQTFAEPGPVSCGFCGVIALINEDVDLTPLTADGDWRERLAKFARSYHDAFARHPQMVSVAMQRPIQTPAALDLFEREFALLLEAGWDPLRASAIVASMDHLVLGSALETFAAGFDRPAGDYAAEHPVLARVLAESDQTTLAPRSFELGLRACLAGLGEPGDDAARG